MLTEAAGESARLMQEARVALFFVKVQFFIIVMPSPTTIGPCDKPDVESDRDPGISLMFFVNSQFNIINLLLFFLFDVLLLK